MKKLASLALVLTLVLSLAVPALASGAPGQVTSAPYTFDTPDLIATNAVASNQDEYTITCIAPAVFSIGRATAANEIRVDKVTENGLTGCAGDRSDFSTVTIAESGEYRLHVGLNTGDKFLFETYHVTILPGEGEPVPPAPVVGPTTNNNFTDVNAGDWFYDAVLWAVEKDITKGTTATTFSPMQTCTEAQILTFLWRAKGCPEPKNPVPSDTYYAKAAKWAVEQGIVDEFEADVPCTRAMTVDFLWRAAGRPQAGDETAFTDVAAGTNLEKAVAWAVEAGVTTGTSETTFSPEQICSRGQIVTFLYRNLK